MLNCNVKCVTIQMVIIMSKTATLNIRIDPSTKESAEEILQQLGLSMSTAVEIYLRQIVLNKEIPFYFSTTPQKTTHRVLTLKEIRDRLIPLAKQYGVNNVYLFGSYARGEATQTSDVDFHAEPGEAMGLDFFAFQDDLEQALGKSVDLISTASVDRSFREEIRQDEILLYAKE